MRIQFAIELALDGDISFMDKNFSVYHGLDNETIFDSIEECKNTIQHHLNMMIPWRIIEYPLDHIIEWCEREIKSNKIVRLSGGILEEGYVYENLIKDTIFDILSERIQKVSKEKDHIAYGLLNNLDETYWVVNSDVKPVIPHTSLDTYIPIHIGKCDEDQFMLLRLTYGDDYLHYYSVSEIKQKLIDLDSRFEDFLK